MGKKKMNAMDWIAYWLVIVGALNWLVYGVARLFGKSFDLVTWAFQWMPKIGYGVFVVVGIAGLYGIYTGIKLLMK